MNHTLLFYTLAIPAMGVIVWQRYDLAPALLVVLALAAWVAGWNKLAWAEKFPDYRVAFFTNSAAYAD